MIDDKIFKDVRCSRCLNNGSESCPLLHGVSLTDLKLYDCPDYKVATKEIVEKIKEKVAAEDLLNKKINSFLDSLSQEQTDLLLDLLFNNPEVLVNKLNEKVEKGK